MTHPTAAHRHNQMMIDRIKGVPATPGTPESDADPRNPSVISPVPSPEEIERLALASLMDLRSYAFLLEQRQSARDAALEEAIKVCRDFADTSISDHEAGGVYECAARLEALKRSSPPAPDGALLICGACGEALPEGGCMQGPRGNNVPGACIPASPAPDKRQAAWEACINAIRKAEPALELAYNAAGNMTGEYLRTYLRTLETAQHECNAALALAAEAEKEGT